MSHHCSLTYDERMEGSWTFSPFFCQTYEVTSVAGSAIHLKHIHTYMQQQSTGCTVLNLLNSNEWSQTGTDLGDIVFKVLGGHHRRNCWGDMQDEQYSMCIYLTWIVHSLTTTLDEKDGRTAKEMRVIRQWQIDTWDYYNLRTLSVCRQQSARERWASCWSQS